MNTREVGLLTLPYDDILRQHRPRDIELYGLCVVIEDNSDVHKDFLTGKE